VILGAAALLSAGTGRLPRFALTAQQAVDRIRANAGVPWARDDRRYVQGRDPQTVVTGIATTVMATLPVLREAAAAGRNLIVTCEPTFYNGNDEPGTRANDAVYLAKKAFIDEHHLVVWRFSDHWGARVPSEFATALAETLGWGKLRSADKPADLCHPVHRAGRAGRGCARATRHPRRPARDREPRHAGSSVLVSPGTTTLQSTVANLPKADVILSGEPREWEAVEYVLDTGSAGQPKGMNRGWTDGLRRTGHARVRRLAAFTHPEVPVAAIAVGILTGRSAL